MKIWFGYGSEHSMNLVMIGRFKDTGSAASAKRLIDRLTRKVTEEVQAGRLQIDGSQDRFPNEIREFLNNEKVYDIGPAELGQFAYDVTVKLDGDTIVMRTDESDVSSFLKVLLNNEARVEVFSAHFYPEAETARGG